MKTEGGGPAPRRLGFWLILMAGLVLVLEGITGLYRHWYDQSIGGCGFPDGFFIPKETTGFAMSPGFEGRFTRGEYRRISIRTNRDGYRDGPFDEPGDGPRVALLGDSIVFGAGVTAEDALDSRLEEILPGGRSRVLNLGVYAYSFEQYLAVLDHEVPALNADLAVVGFCVNDIENGTHAWPIAVVQGGARVTIKRWSHLAWLVSHLRARFLRPDSAANFRATREHWRNLCDKTVDQWLQPSGQKRLGRNLDRLAALGSEPGRPPVMAVIWPLKLEIQEPEARWKEPRRILRGALEERGIPYVDLFDGFAAAENLEELYLPDDPMHFSPAGIRRAAQLLAPHLQQPGRTGSAAYVPRIQPASDR